MFCLQLFLFVIPDSDLLLDDIIFNNKFLFHLTIIIVFFEVGPFAAIILLILVVVGVVLLSNDPLATTLRWLFTLLLLAVIVGDLRHLARIRRGQFNFISLGVRLVPLHII